MNSNKDSAIDLNSCSTGCQTGCSTEGPTNNLPECHNCLEPFQSVEKCMVCGSADYCDDCHEFCHGCDKWICCHILAKDDAYYCNSCYCKYVR